MNNNRRMVIIIIFVQRARANIAENVCGPLRSTRTRDEDEEMADEPAVRSHSEAFTCFSKCVRWLKAQTDIDPASNLLLRRQQQKAANKRSASLQQLRINSFFSTL